MLPIRLKRLLSEAITLEKDLNQDSSYKVETKLGNDLLHYSQIDIHLTLYPYSRNLKDTDIVFSPYEDYYSDILQGVKTVFREIPRGFEKIFGILVGLSFVVIFYFFNPEDLTTIQSIAAIIGIYFVGKEAWREIANGLIWATRNLPIRYVGNQYSFQKEEKNTLSSYLELARERKYSIPFWIPTYLDIIKQSNSQTIKLGYKSREIDKDNLNCKTRILTIETTAESERDLLSNNLMVALKYSLSQRFLFVTMATECFQALDKSSIGCLDEHSHWHLNSVFIRNIISIGAFKWYIRSRIEKAPPLLTLQHQINPSR